MSFVVWVAVLGGRAADARADLFLPALDAGDNLGGLPAAGYRPSARAGSACSSSLEDASLWMEHLTEVAVLFSLFVSGLKLRLLIARQDLASRLWPGWPGDAIDHRRGLPVTALGSATGVGASLLIAAILAPTDPVLAALVQVNDARDNDCVRFGLSGEAGLNDGIAFPFVILGLLFLNGDGHPGAALDGCCASVVWAIPAGLLSGYWMGRGIGRVTLLLRIHNDDSTLSPNDYLALALIALAYVVADAIGGYGFLAVFAAGLGLRQEEVKSTGASQPPAEHLVQPVVGHQNVEPGTQCMATPNSLGDTQVAAGIMMGDMLSFGSLVERAMEVFLVTLLGMVLMAHWDWRALAVGGMLFCVIRPLSVALMPWGALLDRRQRLLIGWFGIRGIGSLLLPVLCVESRPGEFGRHVVQRPDAFGGGAEHSAARHQHPTHPG
jgi:NhaP-type Na+/H+ or K+/H+ antiporter